MAPAGTDSRASRSPGQDPPPPSVLGTGTLRHSQARDLAKVAAEALAITTETPREGGGRPWSV